MTRETMLLVKRGDLRTHRIAERDAPALEDGQALLRVDAFALTANTITYAAFGEMMRYWDFFPAPETGDGRPPAWGFCDVLESRAPGVSVGDRFYGYVPFGSHLIVAPARVDANGFVDGSAHRQALPPVYNGYTRVARADAADEAMRMLLAPLFTTSFVLDAQQAQHDQFGASRVLLSSASSKTAIGLAYLLLARGVPVIGLTSPGNVDFCRSLNIYADVREYADASKLDRATTAYVDFAGSAALRQTLHAHLQDALKADIMVGATDWDAGGPLPQDLPGVAPEFFFAPDVIRERVAEWGRSEFDRKLSAATKDFAAFARGWIKVKRSTAGDAERLWADAVEGRIAPDEGVILRF